MAGAYAAQLRRVDDDDETGSGASDPETPRVRGLNSSNVIVFWINVEPSLEIHVRRWPWPFVLLRGRMIHQKLWCVPRERGWKVRLSTWANQAPSCLAKSVNSWRSSSESIYLETLENSIILNIGDENISYSPVSKDGSSGWGGAQAPLPPLIEDDDFSPLNFDPRSVTTYKPTKPSPIYSCHGERYAESSFMDQLLC
jgi:hypothetical protein